MIVFAMKNDFHTALIAYYKVWDYETQGIHVWGLAMSIGASIIIAGFTALFGAAVLVMGQITIKFLIDSIHDLRKTIGEIAYNTLYLSNVYDIEDHDTPEVNRTGAKPDEASKTLRDLACRINSSAKSIYFYDMLAYFQILPKRINIENASVNLIGWSNGLSNPRNHDSFRDRIMESLDIKMPSPPPKPKIKTG
jgi:hypothetical protein